LPQRLYGREAEIEALLEAFARVRCGTPEVVLIGGYSGIGKSALVHEIRLPITEHRGFFLPGKFEQYHRALPYQALIQALGEVARQILMDNEDRVARWRTTLLEAVRPNGRVITDLVPTLEGLLGPQPDLPDLAPGEIQ